MLGRHLGDELQCMVHRKRLEMMDVEEAEERLIPGKPGEQLLRCAQSGDPAGLLQEGPPLPLPHLTQPLKGTIEVLHHDQQVAPIEALRDAFENGFRRIVGGQGLHSRPEISAKLVRVLARQLTRHLQRQIDQARDDRVLPQPGNAHTIRQRAVPSQAKVGEGEKMGLATAAWPDQQNVVPVARGQAAFEPLHQRVEQFLPLDEDALEDLGIRVARCIGGNQRLRFHLDSPRASTHHLRISGKRNEYRFRSSQMR